MSGAGSDLAGLNVSVEDFLAGVLQAGAQPIWAVDHDGVIRFASAAAIAALGYERADELLGRGGHETIHGRHPDGTPHPAAECPLLRPRDSDATAASDLDWFVRRDGSTFPVSWVSVPLAMRDGRGAIVAFTDIENRVSAEQVLRGHYAGLTAQQASLRRVATLVAGGAASADVFAAVTEEVGHVSGLPLVAVWRYESDETATVLGAWSDRPQPFQAGTRWPLDGPTICAQVLQTGGPARIDDFADLPGTIADAARDAGIRACAGAPIIIDGEVWGAMSADSTDREPLPAHIEYRLAEFTELLAAAISTTASREENARLADEQAALRRVATLVARGVPPADVFAAVTREVGQLLNVSATHMGRYDAAGAVTGVGTWSRDGVHDARGHPARVRRQKCRGVGVHDRSPGAAGSLRRRLRRDRRHRSCARDPIVGRRPDRRRRVSLGRDDRLLERRPAAPGGRRGEDRRVHRARCHGDLEHRGADGGGGV